MDGTDACVQRLGFITTRVNIKTTRVNVLSVVYKSDVLCKLHSGWGTCGSLQ